LNSKQLKFENVIIMRPSC